MNVRLDRKRLNWKIDVLPAIDQRLQAFRSQGIVPTLRAMFYALVSLEVIPNSQSYYKTLSEFTARARRGGILPIDCFADNSRGIIQDFDDRYQTLDQYISRGINHLRNAQSYYFETIPRWTNQPHYVEIWTEKDAMVATLRSILMGKQIRIAPIKGYDSVSNENKNINRLRTKIQQGKEIHIRYFGDLDPTGEHIEEIVNTRFTEYGIAEYVDFKRVAIADEHIDEFNLPRNPDPEVLKKLQRDPRAKSFIAKHGELFQVEVDALQAYAPQQFRTMVLESISPFYHQNIYDKLLAEHSTEEINRLVQKRILELQDRLD